MLRIKELRAEIGLTQKELAEKIGSTSKSIWAYENKVAIPPLDVLAKLADTFACSIDYLSGRSDDFGNVTVYQQTDNVAALSADEQKIIDAIRKTAPTSPVEWVTMYAALPKYMQENIFAELKGMHLGYVATVNMNTKEKN
jgi:transcriptional regulator with XRE-family HTH domain